jgi:hypothetical protein
MDAATAARATAQYAIFDEQNQAFFSGQETVILTLTVLDTTTGADGAPRATRLSVSVTYAAHDFQPCAEPCRPQSFDDLKKTVTATATRTS